MIGDSRVHVCLAMGCAVALTAITAVVRVERRADRSSSMEELERVVPRRSTGEGFVSSDTCGACHPGYYASWHRTFHRTMTQVASPQAVAGDFQNVRLDHHGKELRLERRGDEFWVNEGREERRIVMITGSHHYQVYWVRSREGDWLENFPFVYLLEDRRWIPRNDVFLMPPEVSRTPEKPRVWNSSCIQCHSTHGQPGIEPGPVFLGSRVAELGIACEACHGPAAEHALVERSPLRRYTQHMTGKPDPTIVHPGRCSPRTASQICGQCHSIFRKKTEKEREEWYRRGFVYRAGGDLERARFIARHPNKAGGAAAAATLRSHRIDPAGYFWPDGMVRISGREYNGLIESPCYQRGDLSCLSCHSMHAGDPDDQLSAGMGGDEACLQCHDAYRQDIAAHTHHPASSTGSRCYNCHMPHTTYGLLKAIRSHEIDSPSVDVSARFGRPNACNLCHLDRTLGWAAGHLNDWYDIASGALSAESETIAAAVLWLVKGDAGQRAIAAWHAGWPPAQEASGREWLAPLLARLLDDPYSAVRKLASRSLRTLPGFARFEYDYIGSAESRASAVARAVDAWKRGAPGPADRPPGLRPLFDPDGALNEDTVAGLARERDDRPVDLLE